MASQTKKCEFFSCKKIGWRSLSIAPGTFLLFCKEHYIIEAKENFGEDYRIDDIEW